MTARASSPANYRRAIAGIGAILGLMVLIESYIVMVRPSGTYSGLRIGVATSLPFIALLLVGSYWLHKSAITPQRYRRITAWCAGGLIGFSVLILGVSVSTGITAPLRIVGTFRWAASIGAAGGLLIGIFEARAIERTMEAHRTRVEYEATKQERERLDEFAGIISHDLRNPMNVAKGHVELAREECESDRLDTVATALDRMDTIIEDTLTLARQGQVVKETDSVPLDELVRQCWGTVNTPHATLHVHDDLRIDGDVDRLRHVFENLFRNSIEHAGPDVTVHVGSLSHATGFYVEDDGPGVPETDHDRVFEPGFSTADDGSGLGLNIVKQIIHAHGWEITPTNGQHGGVRFEIVTS